MNTRNNFPLPSFLRETTEPVAQFVSRETPESNAPVAPVAPNTLGALKTTIFNVSRRGFLKTSALAASGTFVLGVFSGCSSDELPDLVERAAANGSFLDAPFQPSVYVGINSEGDVFVINPRAEMGQGVRSSVHVVIADELGADLDRVDQEQADGDTKYGNMNTDGSTSIRNLFDQWRTAGATAREMLIAAAATRWGVAASECSAHDHAVHHKGLVLSAGCGELAAEAAALSVPPEPSFRPRSEWKYIGTKVSGYDNQDIVTGTATFGLDVIVPGMLFASVEHPPTILGSVTSFDDTAARAVPGVVDVVELPTAKIPVHFKSLGGIAVIATNTWAAFKGREALNVTWQAGPNAGYSSDLYRLELEASAAAPGQAVVDEGDADAMISAAGETFEASYYVPMLAHAPMEVPNATAWYRDDGTVECWAPTQNAIAARQAVAQYLEMDEANVTVHVTLLGGAFGRKSKADFVVEAALISRAVGKPVKLTWKREDCTKFDYFHAPAAQTITTALRTDGIPTAWRHRSAFPSISSIFAPGVDRPSAGELGLGATTVSYNIPNIRVEACQANAHVRIGWLRSVCNIQHSFAVNAMTGELAHRAGRDQLEYFMDIIGPDRDMSARFGARGRYGEDLVKAPWVSQRLKHVLQVAADSAGYGTTKLADNEAIGLAAQYSFASYVAWAIRVRVDGDKYTILRADGAIDAGTIVNRDRVLSQMEGNLIFGVTLAKYGKITATNGAVDQGNFTDYQLARMNEIPEIHAHIVDSEMIPGGVGEPGLPPVAPAIANAILQVTGTPVRELPIKLG